MPTAPNASHADSLANRHGLTLGIAGLGLLGTPIAWNLIRAGFNTHVYNRTPAKTVAFEGAAHIAPTFEALVNACTTVLLVVTDDAAAQALITHQTHPSHWTNKTLVNMSTLSPAGSLRLQAHVHDHGGVYIEAPVAGSRVPAEQGQLVIMTASHHPTAVEALAPVFAALGKHTMACGHPPQAMQLKLANNLLLLNMFQGLAEAVHFAQSVKLPLPLLQTVIQEGPLNNAVFNNKLVSLIANDTTPQALLKNVLKDATLITQAAQASHATVPNTVNCHALLKQAMAKGLGDGDVMGLLTLLAE
jgi:3-hydroxyisobutyrate dehydrogenase